MLLTPDRKVKVLVIGDCMLDETIRGEATRLAPECPVPVLRKTQETTYAPGGAANVAANVQALGGEAYLLGLVGSDVPGAILERLAKAGWSNLHIQPGHTITKTRTYAGQQLLSRTDVEGPEPNPDWILNETKRVIDLWEPDIIVLSDYCKGCIVPGKLLPYLFKTNIPIIVDTKNDDLSVYAGAHFVKPNLNEAVRAVGGNPPHETIDDIVSIGCRLRTRHQFGAVIITCGARGVVWCGPTSHHEPAYQPREIFDLMGAGDTLLAAFAVTTAELAGFDESMQFMVTAAGLVVGKSGTATVTRKEVLDHIDPHNPIEFKVLQDEAALAAWLTKQRENKRRIVFTNGVFDLLHPGHHHLLRVARRRGDVLLVGLNSDASAQALKGPGRPLISQQQRALALADLCSVDAVYVFQSSEPTALINIVKPDVLVKGEEYKGKVIPGAKELEGWGGKLYLAPSLPGFSTTELCAKIADTPQMSLRKNDEYVPLAAHAIRFDGDSLDPVLYDNGKRVTSPWQLRLIVNHDADSYGGNANTA